MYGVFFSVIRSIQINRLTWSHYNVRCCCCCCFVSSLRYESVYLFSVLFFVQQFFYTLMELCVQFYFVVVVVVVGCNCCGSGYFAVWMALCTLEMDWIEEHPEHSILLNERCLVRNINRNKSHAAEKFSTTKTTTTIKT